MKYAPLYITTLCRYKHFYNCVESLKRNSWASNTDVFIGFDYPPSEKYRSGWEKIKEYLNTSDFSMFASFTVLEREKNYGSSANSRATREYMLSLGYDRWIYVEDDLEFSPNFLEYIDKCLDYYEDDPEVVGVTGYSYPVEWNVSDGATCFKQKFNASVWGTGHWVEKRKPVADFLRNQGLKKSLEKVLKNRLYEDMIDTAKIEYFNEAFSLVHYLKKNWMRTTSDMGVRAYLAVENKYYITPIISKVRNRGFDGSGANCQNIKGSADDPAYASIDTNESFDLICDTLNDYDGNKERMNANEVKTKKEMRRTRFLIWCALHIGSWFSKLVLLLLVPFDILKLTLYKIKK